MYAKKIIERKLEKFAARQGWMPQYHTVDQIHEFKSYVDSITAIERNTRNAYVRITRMLKENQMRRLHRWIENEQVLCSIDQHYWATRYAFIIDEKNDVFQFEPRKSQEIFFEVCAYFDDLEVAIEIFVLKARQVGISTMTALMFLHRLLFLPNTQAVMASVKQDKSDLIARILEKCYDRCPWWLVPRQTTNKTGEIQWENDSIVQVQSGSQATGLAQGWTPTAVHISELADIPNPKKTIDEGLLRATHSSRKLFMVLEGTGGGNTGWQADFWRAAKEGFPVGESRFCPLFLNWPLATDLYPEADWIKKFPIPENWVPGKECRKHVQRCELYVNNNAFLSIVVGPNWKVTRQQQWFWEFNYKAAVKANTVRTWTSQMPADDLEALTGKNDIIFEPEVIEVHSQNLKPEYTEYAVLGKSIDDGFEPDPSEVDYDQQRIEVHYENHKEQEFDWILVPLRPSENKIESHSFDRIFVWEPPLQGRDYSIGIDTADGLGKPDEDRTIINVTQSATGNHPDVQCAELASLRINPPQAVGFAACLGAWYGAKCRDPRGTKFIIEQRERPGDDCQLQLKLMGFTFQHKMIRYDNTKVKENDAIKEGWYSGTWSVPLMMNRFIDAIKNGWYRPNSKWLLAELADLEKKVSAAGKTKIEHKSGKKDDRVRAAAMAYFTRHHLDILVERATKSYTLHRGNLPEIKNEYANVGSMSVGD